MILYALPISNFCSKVAIVLRHKQIPHQILPPPNGYGSPEYKLVVPTGKIPGLVDGELVLSESEAINEYLEEQYPNPVMLPGDQKRERNSVNFRGITIWQWSQLFAPCLGKSLHKLEIPRFCRPRMLNYKSSLSCWQTWQIPNRSC